MTDVYNVIDRIKKQYEPYEEFAVSELQKADQLREDWEKAKDPEWLAFRENPKTKALYRHAANVYKTGKIQLANDDGTMPQEQRLKLHISGLWAQWFMRALGGTPEQVRKDVEEEITRFAKAAGVEDV